MLVATFYIVFAVVLISLGVVRGVVSAGRPNGVSLRPPRWLKRFVLDERNGH
jgi:hypothetical protein